MRKFSFALTLAILPSVGFSQIPIINTRGIKNAASFTSPGLPSGPIAQGSLFSIFGSRLGPASSPTLAFPLTTTLAGVSVSVTQGGTTVAAIPVYVGPGQINAIMPSNAPLGTVSIRVTSNNIKGPPSPAVVIASSFGAFTLNGAGFGPGVMQNFISGTQTPINTPSAPAVPGQTIILYGTGLGPALNPDNVAPTAGNLSTKVELFVGGILTPTQYSGRSPCCSGLDTIIFQVPSNAPLGCWVPLQVRTGGTTVSNTVTMAISANGAPCSDAANALTAPFLAAQKFGVIAFLRTDVTEDIGMTSAQNVTTDAAMITFQQESASTFAPFNPFLSLPPPGSCTAYTSVGDLFDGDPFPLSGTTGKFLDAGTPLTLQIPGVGTRNLARPATNALNFQPLGYTYTGSFVPSSLFLNPGNFTLAAPGGANVSAFQASFSIASPASLSWTNRDQTEIVTKTQGFTVSWTGASAGQSVIVFGGGVDLPSNGSAIFACVASPGASSFTVPPVILGNIAPTRTNLLQSKGVVYVGALPFSKPTPFTAGGLDTGAILAGAFVGKTVIFQ